MLIVDPWHWLDEDGDIPSNNPRLRANLLNVLRVIEYGSPLRRGSICRTLIECKKRPGGRRCIGLLCVMKMADDRLLALCPECETEVMVVPNWENTKWSRGAPIPESESIH